MTAVSAGWPQAAGPPPAPAPEQATPQQATPQLTAPPNGPAAPPAPENPGLIDEMGKVLEKSLSILPTLKSPSETFDDLNARAKDAAKDAGESLSRLAKPASMATGRLICPVSANGASDCKIAADKLCQSKGFKEGKSLTTEFGGGLFGQGADSGPYPEARRLPNRQFRHPRAVPIVSFVIRERSTVAFLR